MNIRKKIEIDLTERVTIQQLIGVLEKVKDQAGADSEVELFDYDFVITWTEEV